MSSEKLPVITDELIFALDQVFPNRHPDLSLTDREVWYRAGQRSLVDYLIEQQARQKELCSPNQSWRISYVRWKKTFTTTFYQNLDQ